MEIQTPFPSGTRSSAWTERRPSKPKVPGSNPAGPAIHGERIPLNFPGYHLFFLFLDILFQSFKPFEGNFCPFIPELRVFYGEQGESESEGADDLHGLFLIRQVYPGVKLPLALPLDRRLNSFTMSSSSHRFILVWLPPRSRRGSGLLSPKALLSLSHRSSRCLSPPKGCPGQHR